MKRSAKVIALLALVALLGPPTAWGCAETGMPDCSMAGCEMTDPNDSKMSDCHDEQQESRSCDVEAKMSFDCCDMSAAQEPVEATGDDLSNLRTESMTVEVGELETVVVPQPPLAAFRSIQSRQHALGRFTLLSSFLL